MSPRAPLRSLYAATFGYFCSIGMYFAAIPLYVTRELDGSKAAVGLAVGAFSVSAVLMRPLVGRGIDTRGRRPFLLGALALLTVGCLGFFLASTLALVVAVRLVQGGAGGAFYTTAAAMATDLAPVEQRASAIAKFSLFLYAGFAIGPYLAEEVIARSGF